MIKWVGIPYSVPDNDCWSIVRKFADIELDMTYPQYFYDTSNNEQMAQAVIGAVDLMGCWEKVDVPQRGDVLIFRIKGLETHCGIYLQDGEFLHSLAGRMSCIESINDANWQRRLTRIYRWKQGS